MEPKRPAWLPDTQGFLAIAIITLVAAIVLLLLIKPPTIDERTSGVLMTLVGVLIACLKDVYQYFFGSSKGSDSKTETQNKIVEKLTSTDPPGAPGPIAPMAAAPVVVPVAPEPVIPAPPPTPPAGGPFATTMEPRKP